MMIIIIIKVTTTIHNYLMQKTHGESLVGTNLLSWKKVPAGLATEKIWENQKFTQIRHIQHIKALFSPFFFFFFSPLQFPLSPIFLPFNIPSKQMYSRTHFTWAAPMRATTYGEMVAGSKPSFTSLSVKWLFVRPIA